MQAAARRIMTLPALLIPRTSANDLVSPIKLEKGLAFNFDADWKRPTA